MHACAVGCSLPTTGQRSTVRSTYAYELNILGHGRFDLAAWLRHCSAFAACAWLYALPAQFAVTLPADWIRTFHRRGLIPFKLPSPLFVQRSGSG